MKALRGRGAWQIRSRDTGALLGLFLAELRRWAGPAKKKAAPADAASFAREALGLPLDERQGELLASGGKRVIVNCCRQWGKTTMAAAMAVHRALSKAGSLILTASPGERQSRMLVRKARDFARKLGLAARGDGDNEVSVAFPNGSRIVGIPGNEETVRGFSGVDLLIIDEAAYVPDNLYHALRPMLAASDGDLWLLSTPNGQGGLFWKTWAARGVPDASEEWKRVSAPATECPRISAEFLDEERRTLPDARFRQEYLCEFVSPEDGLFRAEDFDAAVDWDLEPL